MLLVVKERSRIAPNVYVAKRVGKWVRSAFQILFRKGLTPFPKASNVNELTDGVYGIC